jgi:hypothetical protein
VDRAAAFTFEPIGDGWFAVEGEGLAGLSVRPRRIGATVRITGITVDGDRAITGATLRALPIGRLAADLSEHLTTMARELAQLEKDLEQAKGSLRPGAINAYPKHVTDEEAAVIEIMYEAAMLNEVVHWADPTVDEHQLKPRGRGAKPPTDDDYKAFAAAYRHELARGRGAKVRVAARVGIDRSTVYRWIKECQRRGLLESGES